MLGEEAMYVFANELKSKKLTPSQREKIISSIREYRSTDDVIAYVFAKTKPTEVTADDERLHSAFCQLKKEHPRLLEGVIFTSGDIFPYSHELQRSIFNLQSSGLMEAPNPVYESYKMSNESKRLLLKRLLPVFSTSEKAELDQMTERFRQLLSKS